MARILMTYTRTHRETGKEHTANVATVRDARQRAAWALTDNLGWSRQDASAAVETFNVDRPADIGPYTFTLTKPLTR